jgi:long-subunit acyl-CoA synthetase (AMP-forming)
LIQQAFVFGDSQPYCVAAICAADPQVSVAHIEQWVKQVNFLLPDYARIKRWLVLDQAITVSAGLLTNNGRPKRLELQTHLQPKIDQLYPLGTILPEAI